MKNTIHSYAEPASSKIPDPVFIDANSSELGSQAPCIGDDPHETNRVEF